MNFSVEQKKKDKTLPKFKHQKFNLYRHIINTECSFRKFYVTSLNKYYKNITLFKKRKVYNKHCRYMCERKIWNNHYPKCFHCWNFESMPLYTDLSFSPMYVSHLCKFLTGWLSNLSQTEVISTFLSYYKNVALDYRKSVEP